jgi:hypothetical protein
MAQCVDAEAKLTSELFLRHVQTGPDRLHIDPGRHMDAIGVFDRFPLGIGHYGAIELEFGSERASKRILLWPPVTAESRVTSSPTTLSG